MGFILEISEQIYPSKRVQILSDYSSATITLGYDRHGVMALNACVAEPILRIFTSSATYFAVETQTQGVILNSGSTLMGQKIDLNCAACLVFEGRNISIFKISQQAQLYTKLGVRAPLNKLQHLRLKCRQLDIDLKIPINSEISIGSSQHDSVLIPEIDIKPRHAILQIMHPLTQSSIYACLGKIKLHSQKSDLLRFSLIGKDNCYEFILS